LAGGCALLLVLAVVGGAVGITSLVNSFQHGGFSCLPSDFPSYPGATVTNVNSSFGTGVAPGDSKSCRVTLASNDDVAAVTAFYEQKLGSGDWKVTAFVSSTGEVRFQRVSRPATVGIVDLLGRGQQTEIQINLDS
jgi:hypothetical protein